MKLEMYRAVKELNPYGVIKNQIPYWKEMVRINLCE